MRFLMIVLALVVFVCAASVCLADHPRYDGPSHYGSYRHEWRHYDRPYVVPVRPLYVTPPTYGVPLMPVYPPAYAYPPDGLYLRGPGFRFGLYW